MFEKLKEIKRECVILIFPAEFDSSELLDLMAPSILIGVEPGKYVVSFDPRSVMASGSFDEIDVEGLQDVLKNMENLFDMPLKIAVRADKDAVKTIFEEIRFYQEMGVYMVESDEKLVSYSEFEKLKEKFKMFTMIAEKSKNSRYSLNPNMLSVSPGIAGLSMFLTLDTKFMIWLKNETAAEGEGFKYGLIRIFNLVASKLARHFEYERMQILPYESLIVLNRDVEKLSKFLKTLDVANTKLREFLKNSFKNLISKIKVAGAVEIADIFKSKDTLFETIASLPDEKSFEHFKGKLIGSIEKFNASLEPIASAAEKLIEDLLKEVSG